MCIRDRSQLHQLRGRVGRGARQSYCIFFGADKGEAARERLKILCKTGDGFEIARADLAQRCLLYTSCPQTGKGTRLL